MFQGLCFVLAEGTSCAVFVGQDVAPEVADSEGMVKRAAEEILDGSSDLHVPSWACLPHPHINTVPIIQSTPL